MLGLVGRLQRWTRVELAIGAMPAVLHALARANLRVIGDSTTRLDYDHPAELQARARERVNESFSARCMAAEAWTIPRAAATGGAVHDHRGL